MTANVLFGMSRFLLSVYFAAFAALSLSYIHVEDEGCVLSIGSVDNHHQRSVHVLLHEIFFAHFGSSSEHIAERTIPQYSHQGTNEPRNAFFTDSSTVRSFMPHIDESLFSPISCFIACSSAKGSSGHDLAASGLSPPPA